MRRPQLVPIQLIQRQEPVCIAGQHAVTLCSGTQSSSFGIYGVRFFHPGDDRGAAGVGPTILYYDGLDGRYLGDRIPWRGTAADIFLQAQFPPQFRPRNDRDRRQRA